MSAPAGRGARLAGLSASHAAADFYQGCVAVMVPFLVLGESYTYAQATGLVLGATIGSSVAQPLFGLVSDRGEYFTLIPVSLFVASGGLAAVGVTDSYPWAMIAVVVSGLGVAGYHPEAARLARRIGGRQARAMSLFIVGGNLGLALAPLVAAPLLITLGMGALPFIVVPGAVAALGLWLGRSWLLGGAEPVGAARSTAPANDWRSFRWLTLLAVLRAGIYFGVASFVGVLVVTEFHTGQGVAAAALTLFLVVGAGATLVGGWLADRHGRLTAIRLGFLLTVPGLALLTFSPGLPLALVAVVICGVGAFLGFSVQTTLGQEYLPRRLATASGMTIGFSVSAGGAISPVLGVISDHRGPRAAVAALLALSTLALLVSSRLRESGPRPEDGGDARPPSRRRRPGPPVHAGDLSRCRGSSPPGSVRVTPWPARRRGRGRPASGPPATPPPGR